MVPQFEFDIVALVLAVGSGLVYVTKKIVVFLWEREKRLEKLFSDVGKIRQETETNGGSTLKDSLLRLESAVSYVHTYLLALEQKLEISFEDIMIGTYETDSDGLCIDVDIPYQRICGRTKEECLGYGWVNNIHPDDRSLVQKTWKESIELGIDFKLKYRFIRPDGNSITLLGTARPVKNDDEITGYVGMVRAMSSDID